MIGGWACPRPAHCEATRAGAMLSPRVETGRGTGLRDLGRRSGPFRFVVTAGRNCVVGYVAVRQPQAHALEPRKWRTRHSEGLLRQDRMGSRGDDAFAERMC